MNAPYPFIAGMFGKRPTPEIIIDIVFHSWTGGLLDSNSSDGVGYGDECRYFKGYI